MEIGPSEFELTGEAYFEKTLQAWILRNFADVSSALRESTLVPSLASMYSTAQISAIHTAAFRYSPEWLSAWRERIEVLAYDLASTLTVDTPIDLVSAVASPWSLAVAIAATGAPADDAARLARRARDLFLYAAHATDSSSSMEARDAAAELAHSFAGTRASGKVQTFVALSQTLPGFLANAWLTLLQNPEDARRLREQPEMMPQAIEELLRCAGPSRAIFREASRAVAIGAANLQIGDRAILLLSAANRDPIQFPEPDRLDFRRSPNSHLAFGGGVHSCAGASLIRIAAAIATSAMLSTTSAIESSGPVEWIGGFAIRAPASLPAVLRRATS